MRTVNLAAFPVAFAVLLATHVHTCAASAFAVSPPPTNLLRVDTQLEKSTRPRMPLPGARHIRVAPLVPPPPPRCLTIVHSAKVLPIAYTSASAALLFRATRAKDLPDAAVLIATAALSLFNFGPSDNKRIASAKRADKKYPPAVAGVAKQRRQAAKTWRSVVRIKTFGQLAGLLRMALDTSPVGVMKGASTVMLANVAFFIAGGGGARHNDDGDFAPMPSNASLAVSLIDTVLCLSALVAAKSTVGTSRRAIGAGIFVAGANIGALEGIASLVSSEKS